MLRTTLCLILTLFVGAAPLLAQDEKPFKSPDPELAKKKWLDENAWPVNYDQKKGLWADYGERLGIAEKDTVRLADLAENPSAFADRRIRMEGRIVAVCAKAGCWLTMAEGGRELFVKFKDYGFFVPRHLAGHDVVLEGLASAVIMTEAERRHMAEDAGKSPEEVAKIVGDEAKLKMFADAVRILEPAVIELGSLARKAPRGEIGVATESEVVVVGTLVKAEAKQITIESAGKRLVIALPEKGLDTDQIGRLKAAEKPVKVEASGRLADEGEERRFNATGVALHVGR